jgi:hypothetical protein
VCQISGILKILISKIKWYAIDQGTLAHLPETKMFRGKMYGKKFCRERKNTYI